MLWGWIDHLQKYKQQISKQHIFGKCMDELKINKTKVRTNKIFASFYAD